MSALVNHWKALDREATKHMRRYGTAGAHLPCRGCDAPTCTYVTDLARQMRELRAQMTEDERRQC